MAARIAVCQSTASQNPKSSRHPCSRGITRGTLYGGWVSCTKVPSMRLVAFFYQMMSTYLILRHHARDNRIGGTILSLEDSHGVEGSKGGYHWRAPAPAIRATPYTVPRQGLAIPIFRLFPRLFIVCVSRGGELCPQYRNCTSHWLGGWAS